jgi:hypothetical protein
MKYNLTRTGIPTLKTVSMSEDLPEPFCKGDIHLTGTCPEIVDTHLANDEHSKSIINCN